jgi:hypothetical protein
MAATREAVLRGYREAGVAHPERREDAFLEKVLQGTTGENFDKVGQDIY